MVQGRLSFFVWHWNDMKCSSGSASKEPSLRFQGCTKMPFLGCENRALIFHEQRIRCFTQYCVIVNSNVGWETSFPLSVAFTPATLPSKQTDQTAADHKQEVRSLNLNFSYYAWLLFTLCQQIQRLFCLLAMLWSEWSISQTPGSGYKGRGFVLLKLPL